MLSYVKVNKHSTILEEKTSSAIQIFYVSYMTYGEIENFADFICNYKSYLIFILSYCVIKLVDQMDKIFWRVKIKLYQMDM